MYSYKKIMVISLSVLALLFQSGFVKEGREECLHCVKCYDKAWDDGYKLGKATGTVNERYRIIRNLINAQMNDEQIIQYAHTSYVELEDVKNQLKIFKGRFEFEMPQ
jgi:hypothetical protein